MVFYPYFFLFTKNILALQHSTLPEIQYTSSQTHKVSTRKPPINHCEIAQAENTFTTRFKVLGQFHKKNPAKILKVLFYWVKSLHKKPLKKSQIEVLKLTNFVVVTS